MLFKRELICVEKVELTETTSVNLGVIFKQYDAGTSILVLDTTYFGAPTEFVDEKVYMTYKVSDRGMGTLLPITNNLGKRILDVCNYETNVAGRLSVKIDSEVLTYSGDIAAELVVVSADNTSRFTSPTLKFKIEPSLMDNEVAISGKFKCGELKCAEDIIPVEREVFKVSTFLNKTFLDSIKAEGEE